MAWRDIRRSVRSSGNLRAFPWCDGDQARSFPDQPGHRGVSRAYTPAQPAARGRIQRYLRSFFEHDNVDRFRDGTGTLLAADGCDTGVEFVVIETDED